MDQPNLQLPSSPGAYVLLIILDKPTTIDVGRLGAINFPAGCYAYVGSALNGLSARVGRHLRRRKKLHWHVDYLLQKARISEVAWTLSNQRLECRIADVLQHQGLHSIPKFGASDCKCPSHLFQSPTLRPLRNAITHAITTLGALPSTSPISP